MKHTLIIILLTFFFVACSQKPTDVVAVKVGDEIYATDDSASDALANKDSDEEVVCRKTQKTGSRMQSRVCSTRRQIELDREEDKRKISDNIQHNSTVNTIGKKGG